jgi:hypothetical protein
MDWAETGALTPKASTAPTTKRIGRAEIFVKPISPPSPGTPHLWSNLLEKPDNSNRGGSLFRIDPAVGAKDHVICTSSVVLVGCGRPPTGRETVFSNYLPIASKIDSRESFFFGRAAHLCHKRPRNRLIGS